MSTAVRTSCIFCSLGCPLIIESRFNEAVALDYDRDDPVSGGKLCAKGNYALELINHPLRLTEPKSGGHPIPLSDAVERIMQQVRSASSVGMIISGDVSREDVLLVSEYIKTFSKSGHIALHVPTGDDAVSRALDATGASELMPAPQDITHASFILAVGDPFEIGPVVAGPVVNAKYDRKGNTLAVISDSVNKTARFANVRFIGNERQTLAKLLWCLAGESDKDWCKIVRESIPGHDETAIHNLAAAFGKTDGSVLVLATQDPLTASLAALVVRAAGRDKKLLPIISYMNIGDILRAGIATDSLDVLLAQTIQSGFDILFILGADVFNGKDAAEIQTIRKNVRFLVAASPFENATTRVADLVIPSALWLETLGTYRGTLMPPVITPPGMALTPGELMKKLAIEAGRLIAPAMPPAVAVTEPTPESVAALLKRLDEPQVVPHACSSAERYGDGAITDNMSWMQIREVHAW